jgi:hypothetical protein
MTIIRTERERLTDDFLAQFHGLLAQLPRDEADGVRTAVARREKGDARAIEYGLTGDNLLAFRVQDVVYGPHFEGAGTLRYTPDGVALLVDGIEVFSSANGPPDSWSFN